MASATLQQILMPQVIVDVISRIRRGQQFMGRFLGFHGDQYNNETVSITGPNTKAATGPQASVRTVSYRIFDRTRVISKGRAPGTGPATVSPNEVGTNQVVVARSHQKINLLSETLGNLSAIVGPNSNVDPAGQDYIYRQEMFMAEQFNNFVEALATGMLRDSLYFIMQGDDWYPTFTAPTATQVGFQIPFQIPSTNKAQLANQMGTVTGGGNLIGTSWANTGAPILNNVMSITAALVQLTGYAMTDVICNSILMNSILLNDQLRSVAGTANTVFAEYAREPMTFPDGKAGVYYTVVLKALPNVRFHVCDDVLATMTDIDPSYSNAPSSAQLVKVVPDTMAIFTTNPDPDWTYLYHGGEYVCDNPGSPMMLRTGYYAWREWSTQPSALELLGLLNAIPFLLVPKNVAPAQVVFS